MMSARTQPCDKTLIAGRSRKATQFLDAAETIREFADDEAEVGDAYVTLCVHAEAIAELSKVGRQHGQDLHALLAMKTRAGYGYAAVNSAQRKRAGRAARRLVEASRLG